ncbi:Meckel syndrome type 1 protein homolog isoform X2 [Folsomia candida]|uniref:Meckel syndrome type 1 protein homolog isoform X2 n=1 Tax=Folsomia candida TaxID=158441 RepID=UPI001604E61B|nr:Meckel syndrome type 1 protein homolog isoform X2 [Folsomia candida]
MSESESRPPSSGPREGHHGSTTGAKDVERPSLIMESPQDNVVLGWVKLTDLPPLPRIEKAQPIASTHRYHGPLSGLKLRVRLLEYPSLSSVTIDRKDKNKERLLSIVQDRIFSWQEKVDGSVGDTPRLYSYVDTDIFVARQGARGAVETRRKEVPAPQGQAEDEEWEDADATSNEDSTVKAPTTTTSSEGISDPAKKVSTTKQKTKTEQETELKEEQRLMKVIKRRQEVEQRHAAVDDFIRQEDASVVEMMGKHLRGKRPKASLSSSILPTTSPSKSRGQPILGDIADGTRATDGKRVPSFTRRTRAVEERLRHRGQISLQSQAMIIVATIPHSKKRVIVCRLKALPTAGVITVKAPFGFRVIHASRTHVYRLSWELHLPPQKQASPQLGRPVLSSTIKNSNTRGVSFELRVWLMGEIVSARGFDSEPLCVHYLLETPTGWTTTTQNSSSSIHTELGTGTTQSSYTTVDGVAHFSHQFSTLLSFSLDTLHHTLQSPVLLLMVVSLKDSGRVRYEGYGYANLPSTPGSHTLRVLTWKPRHRSIVEWMQDLFLDATPSLQDIKAVHIPPQKSSNQRLVGNRLGLQTDPSGEVTVRLHLAHHAPSSVRDQASKLDLLEKMSSATILKSVQKVIDAFNRARTKTLLLKRGTNSGRAGVTA